MPLQGAIGKRGVVYGYRAVAAGRGDTDRSTFGASKRGVHSGLSGVEDECAHSGIDIEVAIEVLTGDEITGQVSNFRVAQACYVRRAVLVGNRKGQISIIRWGEGCDRRTITRVAAADAECGEKESQAVVRQVGWGEFYEAFSTSKKQCKWRALHAPHHDCRQEKIRVFLRIFPRASGTSAGAVI